MDAKGWQYDVQINRREWIRRGHYDVEMKGWMEIVAL